MSLFLMISCNFHSSGVLTVIPQKLSGVSFGGVKRAWCLEQSRSISFFHLIGFVDALFDKRIIVLLTLSACMTGQSVPLFTFANYFNIFSCGFVTAARREWWSVVVIRWYRKWSRYPSRGFRDHIIVQWVSILIETCVVTFQGSGFKNFRRTPFQFVFHWRSF